MNVNIQSIRFKADQKLIDYIEKKYTKLDKYFDRIVDLDVKLRLEKTGQVQDKIVEFVLKVPGDILLATASDKAFEPAVDEAWDTLKRQIRKYKEKMRRHT
jgi:putative sigma-54 modulation protein